MGYKVDVCIKLLGLHWRPDVGCGEVSGGLPKCTRAKEWMDTLKLWWELRDIWVLAQGMLKEVNASVHNQTSAGAFAPVMVCYNYYVSFLVHY